MILEGGKGYVLKLVLRHQAAAHCHLPLRPLPFDFEGAVEVIFEVCISSPIYLKGLSVNNLIFCSSMCTYDCRNLLPPSSFSCSLLTVSTRSTMACKLVCRTFACSMRSFRASSPSSSTSALFRRGDMVRTSFSSRSVSTTVVADSRDTIIVPLLFRLPIFGLPIRISSSMWSSSSLATALELDEDSVGLDWWMACRVGSASDASVLESADMIWARRHKEGWM